jgi:hypothetical protein
VNADFLLGMGGGRPRGRFDRDSPWRELVTKD